MVILVLETVNVFSRIVLTVFNYEILSDNGVIDYLNYLVPYSKCTPFNCLFHVHHCDSTVLSHCRVV